ncbi:MBL fold metallo-hydrolase [Lysinibacter sp. HNR]|uniref:MBL fold metallo-hydrolase n=1 Tax=Lysinibacter sp. HNR TaxID=3031408 RepID=UPI00243547AD|nr:MBL fold metallo-hydrolase [Lysinibacter sp. HNR]WGD37177.1 MBL fold metallo-hydrolase [Lysinibacter sp. HNR]
MKSKILIAIGSAFLVATLAACSPAASTQSRPTETAAEEQNTEEQQVPWDGNTVQLTSQQLADGVYAYYPEDSAQLEQEGFPVATSGGFIIGTDGVLLIETMLNERLYNQVEALIAEATDLPITYAVNTSAHGDHSYGNMYLPNETLIIQHEKASEYISNNIDADKEFMIQNFGAGRGIEEVTATPADQLVSTGETYSLDLGGKTVEIIDFGFAQTGGDLFIWEPESQIMWTGNPITSVEPALPWLLDGNLVGALDTLKKVQEFLPAGARVIPGHGSPTSTEVLQWPISYMEETKNQVQEAIDAGLSLEETVEKVALPNFRGYALFDWVHPQLSVPAAYADLSAH